MPSDERERQFERALQRHMRELSPDSACLDADTLAAYHERTLSLEELAKCKEHIGGCLRCQQILALVEETNSIAAHDREVQETASGMGNLGSAANPPVVLHVLREEAFEGSEDLASVSLPPPSRNRVAGRSSWKWMAPLGALAAGLLLFVAVRERKEPMEPQQTSVEVARDNNEPQVPMATQQNIPQSPPSREESPLSKGNSQDSKLGAVKPPMLSATPPASKRPSSQSYKSATPANEADKVLKDGSLASRELQAKPDSSAAARLQAQSRADLDATRANPESHVSAPAPSAMGEVAAGRAPEIKKESGIEANKAKSAAATPTPTAEAVTVPEISAKNTAQFSTAGNSLLKSAARDSRMIVAPDGKHAWRVGAAGEIEATTDGGKAWNSQASGLSKDLASGSAPSESVCWIVGKAGTILLTTDGGMHWIQIPSPVQDDLGGIHAVDAKHASIWNLRNRKSFETADAGVNWTPTANE